MKAPPPSKAGRARSKPGIDMKHISPNQVSIEAAVRAPTRRALAKQQTRQKVLAAARKLFCEAGYEGATIRDIAAAAGMSTGAVFANFTDKSDLFREIMTGEGASLLEQMREASAKGKDVEDRFVRMFMAGYGFYKSRLPLVRALLAVSWDADFGPQLRNLEPFQRIRELFVEVLTGAAAGGEIADAGDIELRGQMLFDIYRANFTHAIFDGWGLDALQARSRDQVGILLAGARAR
jgi:AcrR family transcriptional regulator